MARDLKLLGTKLKRYRDQLKLSISEVAEFTRSWGRCLLSTLILILAMNRGQPLTLDILLNNESQGSKERDHCDLS